MKFSFYLVRNFLKMFLLVLLSAVIMFIVIDFVGNIRLWLSRGLNDLSAYYLAYLPYIAFLVMPVALFIGIIASVGNMARHLEMSAMQGAGRNPLRSLLPLVFFGILVTGVSLYLDDQVLPDANFKRYQIMEPAAQQRRDPRVTDKRDFTYIGNDKTSWFMRYYSLKERLGRDVVILVMHEGDLTERYDARRLRWVVPDIPAVAKKDTSKAVDSVAVKKRMAEQEAKGFWQLEDGFLRVFQKDGTIAVRPFHVELLGDKSEVRPEDLLNERQRGDEMNASMIRKRIAALRRSGDDTRKLETAYYFKFSGSMTNFLVVLLACALAHRYSRSGGLSQKFGIGIFLVFSYYVVIRIGIKMGENGALSPLLSAWIGHILFGCIALFMLHRSFRL